MTDMTHKFHRFATRASDLAGSPLTFALALGVVLAWFASGFVVGFSDTHQLVINTSTTIVTFLMVFLIQHAANVDDRAVHAKLDEIVRVLPDADDRVRGIEDD